MRAHRAGTAGCLLILCLWLGIGSAGIAQPVLQISRLVNNWPTIELYYTVSCGGVSQTINDVSRFTVREQGFPIVFDTQNCPDTTVRCPLSIALAFDGSTTMAGALTAAAKSAGHRFIDSLDGSTDQAAVLWFNSTVTTAQQMTPSTAALHLAVDAIPAVGGCALFDGVYLAVQEVITRGTNTCKAVVVVASGWQGSGTGTLTSSIALCNSNQIRIFAVALGDATQNTILANAANLTGGRFFAAHEPASLDSIYSAIAHICLQSFQECSLTYTAGCMDGSIRPVDLSVSGICGGTDTKTKSYKAPKDTSTFTTLHFVVGGAEVEGDASFTIPLMLLDTAANRRAGKLTWTLDVPDALAACTGVDVPPGSPFAGLSITMQRDSSLRGGYRTYTFSSSDTVVLNIPHAPVEAAVMNFRAADMRGVDTTCARLDVTGGGFDAGCLRAVFADSILCVRARSPYVVCDVDSLPTVSWDTNTGTYITTPPLFTTRVRNIGGVEANTYSSTIDFDSRDMELTGVLPMRQAGAPDTLLPGEIAAVWWEARLFPRAAGDSVSVNFRNEFSNHAMVPCGGKMWIPVSAPRVMSVGQPRLCEGGHLLLTATRGFQHYKWSDGQSGDTIAVTRGGVYYCTVTDTYGRMMDPPKFSVEVDPRPRPYLDPPGPLVLCDSTPVLLRVMQPFRSYRWSTGESTPSILATRASRYWAEVTDAAGCTGHTDTLTITVRRGPAAVVTGPAQACAGSSSTIRANSIPGAQYHWRVIGADVLLGQDTDAITVRWGRDSVARVVLALIDSAAQCTAVDTLLVSIRVAPVARITSTGATDFCAGDSVRLDAGAGYVSYLWSNGARSRMITVRQSGSYHVTVTDASGCTAGSDTVSVRVRAIPRPRVSGPRAVCVGTLHEYDVNAISGQSARWSVDGGLLASGVDRPRIFVRWNLRGSGRVRVTLADGPCAATDSVDVRIDEATAPRITLLGPTRFCDGDSVLLDAGAGYLSYHWSGGTTGRLIAARRGGDYSVEVRDSSGCTARSDTVTLIVFPQPPAPTISQNGTLLRTVSGYARYTWFRDGMPVPGAARDTLTAWVSGDYVVEVMNTGGCTARSLPYSITVTGMDAPEAAPRLVEVYPEPNQGVFIVQVSAARGTEQLRVYDLLGRIVFETELQIPTTGQVIDLSQLPDGVYLLRLGAVLKTVTKLR